MPAHSKRTPEMVEAILEGMSKGQTLTSLCAGQGISVQTWHDWRYADEALNIAHGRARETGFDVIAEDCLTIADDSSGDLLRSDGEEHDRINGEFVARSRLRVDTRLKLLAKWDPKRYGDKQEHIVTARTVSEVIPVDATPEQAADAYRRLIEG